MSQDRRLEDVLQKVARLEAEFEHLKATALLRVSAAGLPFAVANGNDTTFSATNTSYADFDAVSGGSPGTPIIVSLFVPHTGVVQVTISARLAISNTTDVAVVGYRVSGATTKAATDAECLSYRAPVANAGVLRSWISYPTLNEGVNTIELQARVTGGTGNFNRTWLGARA